MSSHVETIVVGGGQAGLSASWHLKRLGREHLVLDRGKVGDTWRRRWDAFCLVGQNRTLQLPGFPYDGDDPKGFMLRDEIVDYVERFAKSFEPPYREGVEVRRVGASRNIGRFEIDTSEGEYSAENVIIATGTYQHPNIPAWSNKLPAEIIQLHTRNYRNPAQLPDGAILVVGSGQSGCQVVEDLVGAGREVHLCVGNAAPLPRRYRGRDYSCWINYDLPIDKHPLGHEVRFKTLPVLSGRGTIDLRQFGLNGVKLHGRLLDVDGATACFADDLADTLDALDRTCRERLSEIDSYIAENGIEAPADGLVPVAWKPSDQPPTLDLRQARISTVIYGTGYHFDFGWIDLPVFDERGYPRYERGVTEIPGLYFLGLHWLHTIGSGLFTRVGRDAEYVADHLSHAAEQTVPYLT